jgi:hypothetical protein
MVGESLDLIEKLEPLCRDFIEYYEPNPQKLGNGKAFQFFNALRKLFEAYDADMNGDDNES